MITNKDLAKFATLTTAACYHEENKRVYRNLGRKILKHIAQAMGLKDGEFDIRWNPGGIACSGDHTLHTDKVYVALHDNIGMGWFYWRTVTGRRDYTGGQNQIVHWRNFQTVEDVERLVKVLKVAQAGQYTDPQTGDIIMNINMAIRMAAGAA